MSANKTGAFKPIDNIEYSDGSVVSKQIIKSKVGNVTLFAFDAGEGLSEHAAPFDALVQVVDGEAEIIIGGERHTIGVNEAILMPANISHALKANKRFKMILTMIKG
ncbi:MAG: cupin domain-containing protein [Bacteroidales bacterium]